MVLQEESVFNQKQILQHIPQIEKYKSKTSTLVYKQLHKCLIGKDQKQKLECQIKKKGALQYKFKKKKT